MYRFGLRLCSSNTCLTLRYYRKLVRKPVRVHMPVVSDAESTLKYYEDHVSKNKLNMKEKSKKSSTLIGDSSPQSTSGSKPQKDITSNERFTGTSGIPSDIGTLDLRKEIQYKNLDDAGDHIRALLTNVNYRKFRDKNKLFMVEGLHIIREALDAGITPEAIFFSQLHLLLQLKSRSSCLGQEELAALNNLPLYKTPYKTLQTWSSLTTCPGILGVFKHQESCKNYSSHKSLPVTVILDQVREPGNIGGILRTLASVGIDHAILMKGCCDPWESKVLRAACGAHFRIKLISKVTWDILNNYIPENAPLLLADVCQELDPNRNMNVNTQQQDALKVNPVTKENRSALYVEESVGMYEVDSEGNKVFIDPSYDDEEHLRNFENVQLPVYYYDKVEVFQKISNSSTGAVIIIGGEAGISTAAKKFAYVNEGIQVTIPQEKGMDSLNTSVAAGIILYEIRRQFYQLNL